MTPNTLSFCVVYINARISLGNARLKDQLEVDIVALVADKRNRMLPTRSSINTAAAAGPSPRHHGTYAGDRFAKRPPYKYGVSANQTAY
jgi:hypothetical protein